MEEQELTIFQKLEALTISTKLGDNAPYSDHEFVRILQEGEQEHDLDKVYMFVEACERGCGLARAYDVLPMLQEAYAQSPERLAQIIANKRHIERCILLSICNRDMIQEFIRLGCANNMELLYEALRQLIKYFTNWTMEEEEVFISGIVLLSAESEELWIRWLEKKEYQGCWMSLLGKVLPKLSEQALVTYANTIRINMDVRHYKSIYEALDKMSQEEEAYVLRVIGSIICTRWDDYLDDVRINKKYHEGLIFSAYNLLICNAILNSIESYEAWTEEVSKCIDVMYEGLEAWYTSGSQMATVFFVDMTRLYTLLHIGGTLEFVRDIDLNNRLWQLKQYLRRYDFFQESYL